MGEYSIEAVGVDEGPIVYDLLKRSFFKYEPLTCQEEPPGADEAICIKGIKQGFSLKAVDKEKNIVGVVVNMDFSKYTPVPPKSEIMKKVGNFLDYCESKAGLDSRAGGVLTLQVVTVDPGWRGKGLGSRLMAESEALARSKGFRRLETTCTSLYTAKAAASLGWTLKFAMDYSKYTDSSGSQVFNPPEPHKQIQVFVKDF